MVLLGSVTARAQTQPFMNPYYDMTMGEDDVPEGEKGLYEKEWLELKGFFRIRGAMLYNMDLDRGPLPTSGEPLFPYSPVTPGDDEAVSYGTMKLKLHPIIHVGKDVTIHAEVDLLDNITLGSTPEGFPLGTAAIEVVGSSSQAVPQDGVNAWSDSIAVKKLWAEVLTPIGVLVAGRTAFAWGLGMVANPADGIDDDFDEAVDRIAFATSLFDHFVGVSYDFNATGPLDPAGLLHGGVAYDLTDMDDVQSVSLAVLKLHTEPVIGMYLDAGQVVVNYGAYVAYRSQDYDVPYYYIKGIAAADDDITGDMYVERDASTWAFDLWLRINMKGLRIELEAAAVTGSVGNASMLPGMVDMAETTMTQFGGVLQIEAMPWVDTLSFVGEVGVASGDDAYGFGAFPTMDGAVPQAGDLDGAQSSAPDDTTVDNFRFHPNYHVDEILWRRIVGTFTDGLYLKAKVRWYMTSSTLLESSVIYSRALQGTSTPGLANPLGVEWDTKLTYFSGSTFRIGLVYALLAPLSGFRNVLSSLDPTPAHMVRGFMAVTF